VLVGQDLTQYGEDIGLPGSLPGLLEKLDRIEGLRWIRLMYCYPTKVAPALVEAVGSLEKGRRSIWTCRFSTGTIAC